MKILKKILSESLVFLESCIFILIIILCAFWLLDPDSLYEPVIIILTVMLGLIDIYRKIKDRNIELPTEILSLISPGASTDLVKEKFGSPEKIYTVTPSYFGDEFIESKSYFYSFDNANLEIDSIDGEIIETITVHNFTNKVFSVDYIDDLGTLTAQDILNQQGALGKVVCFTSMRYAYIAVECKSDRTGSYFYYTFVCFDWTCPRLYNATYEDEKVYDSDGKEISLKEIIFEAVSVSSLEDHGHPACRMMLE